MDDRSLAEPLWDMIQDAGQPYQIAAGGPNLIDRIEAGLLGYGNEMTQENNPLKWAMNGFAPLMAVLIALVLPRCSKFNVMVSKAVSAGVKFEGTPCPPVLSHGQLPTKARRLAKLLLLFGHRGFNAILGYR